MEETATQISKKLAPKSRKVPCEQLSLRTQSVTEPAATTKKGQKISGKKTFKLFEEASLPFLDIDLIRQSKVPESKYDDDCQTQNGEINVTRRYLKAQVAKVFKRLQL